MQFNHRCPAFSKLCLLPKTSLLMKLHAGCPSQTCVSVFSAKYQLWRSTLHYFFPSRNKFQGQYICAVSILNNAFQHHQNTWRRKMGCICCRALVVLLRWWNFRKPSSDWSTLIAKSGITQPSPSPRCSCTSCSKAPLWATHSFFSFGYSPWIVLKFSNELSTLKANCKLHLLYFVHFAHQNSFRSIKKKP